MIPPSIQCHIKARAFRAAAQGPQFKRGSLSNVSILFVLRRLCQYHLMLRLVAVGKAGKCVVHFMLDPLHYGRK